jgi:hypothetical protein
VKEVNRGMSFIGSFNLRLRVWLIPLFKRGGSRMRTTGSGIKNPRLDILKRAVDMVAEERGGETTPYITDKKGRKRIPCDLAISTPKFRQGLGVKIGEDGGVSFVYDADKDQDGVVRALVSDITRRYTAISVVQGLHELGYDVEVREDGGKVLIQGVR